MEVGNGEGRSIGEAMEIKLLCNFIQRGFAAFG
jgi:hypothetical protein